MKGALLVAGTNSDAGKSMITAGLCRWLRRQGISVAPFKAQNMSLNSFVTSDGGEIGRAQAMQAAAAGLEPAVRMNPVLLKPGSDRRTQVVVLGHPVGEVDAVEYRQQAAGLLDVAAASLAQLRRDYDVVICEGAGSPAEINLRRSDTANMGLAQAAGLPVIVVGDIDRGGALAALYGTVALLEPADQRLIAGFVINKFRGAPELLESGHPHSPLDWGTLARSADTLVLLMAVANLTRIAQCLLELGKPPGTAVACIEQAATARQQITRCTLHDLARPANAPAIGSPAVIVIGPTGLGLAAIQTADDRHGEAVLTNRSGP